MKLYSIVLFSLVASAPCAAADLVQYHEKSEEGLYTGRSISYVDRASLKEHSVGDFSYFSATAVTIRPHKAPTVDRIAVLCGHPQLGLAQATLQMGKFANGTVQYLGPATQVTSLEPFRLKNLERRPENAYAKQAQAVCAAASVAP